MSILVLSGSTRAQSLNTRLARTVAGLLPGATVDADLARLPFYDADVDAAGAPEQVEGLRAAVHAADLVVVVTPEYNGYVPGVLVNALDWLSRPYGRGALRDKPALALSASPGSRGAARALGHLTALLANIGAVVVGAGLAVPHAADSLGEEVSPELLEQLQAVVTAALAALEVSEGADEEDAA
ncbi:NAD(P)H-dependent oxidoreductase [Kineococcus glutinatus]|uniref:NADPH-dependent FMN reductase-like domain-containing protein n=1 Tax=Kineococcus glutinatus TaxID=1070872 RepID=A0ABP9H838_9ACTN